MKKKLIAKKVKKCQEGEILDNQQMYTAGYSDPVTVAASRKLTRKQQMQADEEWREYLKQHPIQIGSEEYNRLPEKAKAQVYKNSVTDAIDRAALPTAVAILAPTAITAGAASLVGSGALTAAANAAGKVLTNPVIDAGLTIHGAITAPENIKKGVEQIKNDEKLKGYGNLALVGLDLFGAGQLIGRTSRMLNPAFRSKHAYNAIVPAGYGDSSGRLKDWFDSMWYNKDVDLKNPDWVKSDKKLYGNVRPDEGYTGAGNYLPDNIKNRGKIADEARQDAWALYTNQPQQYGTYIKNADGTYSYNMDKIIKDSEGTFWPDVFVMDQERYGSAIDAVTGAGGGINSIVSRTKRISTNPNTITNHGYVIMEDVWDLHPFSRNTDKLISDRINKKLKEGLGSSKLKNSAQNIRRYMYDKGHWSLFNKPTVLGKATKFLDRPLNKYRMSQHTIIDNAIDKLTKNKLTKKIDDKLSNFEVGSILGGKPFTLKHNLPFIENIKYSKTSSGYMQPDKVTYQYDFNPPVGISVIDMRKK